MKDKHIRILLVDDDPDVLEIISYNLEQEGFEVLTASNGKQAIKIAKKALPQLIILDVMMPEMDGIEACEQLRKQPDLSQTLITFLTARGEEYSQIAGFEAGADDYITKPVKPKVLISKIKALLRRLPSAETNADILEFKDLIINKIEYTISQNGKETLLPRKEFDLLSLLASCPNKVFKRDEILEKVWGNDVVVGGRTIDVHIRRLREKIGDDYFKAVKGVGYKFVM